MENKLLSFGSTALVVIFLKLLSVGCHFFNCCQLVVIFLTVISWLSVSSSVKIIEKQGQIHDNKMRQAKWMLIANFDELWVDRRAETPSYGDFGRI